MIKDKTTKMGTYLTVAAGASCIAGNASGAIIFYGVNNANDTNADPDGIDFGYVGRGRVFLVDQADSNDSLFSYNSGDNVTFNRGTDLSSTGFTSTPSYAHLFGEDSIAFDQGAVAGDQNYANISFDGDDSTYEAVAQFYFDGMSNGRLIAIATLNAAPDTSDLSGVGGASLSISDGKSLIDAANGVTYLGASTVPEPSSVALLALGSLGLLARRRRVA